MIRLRQKSDDFYKKKLNIECLISRLEERCIQDVQELTIFKYILN